jgi:hypothetical protein
VASPADREAEARADVERIAASMFEEMREASGFGPRDWLAVHEEIRRTWRAAARRLLIKDVIRVGKRPATGPPPMVGQTTLDD